MGIGPKIKEAREILQLTQKELADLVGVTASAITNYETGTSHPKEPILHKLMEALKVDPNFLFSEYFDKKIIPPPINSDGLSAEDSLFSSLSPQAQIEALNYMKFLKDKEASK